MLRRISDEFEKHTAAQAIDADKVKEMPDLLQELARDPGGQDALIEPHIISEGIAGEHQTVREDESSIIWMRPRIEKVRERFMPHKFCVTTPPRPTTALEAIGAHAK